MLFAMIYLRIMTLKLWHKLSMHRERSAKWMKICRNNHGHLQNEAADMPLKWHFQAAVNATSKANFNNAIRIFGSSLLGSSKRNRWKCVNRISKMPSSRFDQRCEIWSALIIMNTNFCFTYPMIKIRDNWIGDKRLTIFYGKVIIILNKVTK